VPVRPSPPRRQPTAHLAFLALAVSGPRSAPARVLGAIATGPHLRHVQEIGQIYVAARHRVRGAAGRAQVLLNQ
jgi:hypothetical protein